jgi:hypothetical protein
VYLLGCDRGLRARLRLRRSGVIACLEDALTDLQALPANVSCGYMTIAEFITLLERDVADLRERSAQRKLKRKPI